MSGQNWTVRALAQAIREGAASPVELARAALRRANGNKGRNTYLWRDEQWTLDEAARLNGGTASSESMPLRGLPISVKDCFDLAGAPTTCGVKFYGEWNGAAQRDSWLVARLRAQGAVITGKTHLHPLAYGITGENAEFGDCVQPGAEESLTGGSSSGAAASVLEGSAVAAIGTDTGGSVRAPAALCGLAGYRASLARGDWTGAGHLAQSFDTMGWLFRDLEDAAILGRFFAPDFAGPARPFARFATVAAAFLHDCDAAIAGSMETFARELEALGLRRTEFDGDWWSEALAIYAPIQAAEAARIHAGHFAEFEPAIRERLEWGARIGEEELRQQRKRHAAFRMRMDALIEEEELLVLPALPVLALRQGADHSQTRPRLLRYTAPFSVAGLPVMTIPCSAGGVQLAAARENDESLLTLVEALGAHRRLNAE